MKAEQAEILAALKSRGIDVDPSAEIFYAEQLGNLAHQATRLRDAGVPLETYEHHFKQSMTRKGWSEGKQRAVLLLVTATGFSPTQASPLEWQRLGAFLALARAKDVQQVKLCGRGKLQLDTLAVIRHAYGLSASIATDAACAAL